VRRLEGWVAVVLQPRPSHDQVAGGLLEHQDASSASLSGVDASGQTVDGTMLPRRRVNKSQPSRCDIFPTGRVVLVLCGLESLSGE
jgi:hypothetical protein